MVTPEYDNFTCLNTKGNSVVDYFMIHQNNIDMCTVCKVVTVSELMKKYELYNLISGKCKPPDHSMLWLDVSPFNAEKYNLCTNYLDADTDCERADIDSSGKQINLEPKMCNSKSLLKKHKFNDLPAGFKTNGAWHLAISEFIDFYQNKVSNQAVLDNLYIKLCTTLLNAMDILKQKSRHQVKENV